jgi:6-phosphogluconolactonase (cycloisomerase 2 family)
MSKKISVVIALVGLCALSLFLLSCGSSSSRPAGVLYVLTQGSNGTGNNVSTFAMDLNSGGLSLVNSNASTCQPAGSSCGLPLNIVLDPKGASAFVLNQGIASAGVAPTIYAYAINSDGSLGAPGTTPAATLAVGDTAVAMVRDALGQFLFVIDQGFSPSLTTCPLPGAIDSSDPKFAGCPSISVFTMQAGSLTLASGTPYYVSKIPSALSAVTYTPSGSSTAQELLFVANSVDICSTGCNPQHNDNTLSVFSVSTAGAVAELTPNSPYAANTDPRSVLAVNTNQAGQNGGVFVYVGSHPASSGALNVFQVCTAVGIAGCTQADVDSGRLVPVVTPPPPATGQNPVGMVVDPTNNFLYVVCSGSNQVFGYRINTTTGELTAPANQQTGSQPVALAIHSSGKFLYTSNSAANNISGFTLSVTSGAMSTLPAVNTPAGPSGMAAR